MKEFKKFEDKIWLSSPTMHGEELEFVHKAFETNWVSPMGENVNEFEKEMAEYIGVAGAVAMDSGTAALHCAMKLAGVHEGSIVLCTDFTFIATVNPVLYEGGTAVFIDSEPDTWNMDPVALEKAFQIYDGHDEKHPVPTAVVVAHLYGTPSKLNEIMAICEKHHVPLIEDAAESVGATYRGRQTGTFGNWAALSYNGNKIITTSGGGMFLSNDIEAAQKVKFWSTQAREKAPYYHHKEIGYNYRMSNVVAGIGRGQLLHLEEHIAKKRKIYEHYKEGLKGVPVKMNPYDEKNSNPNFWLSCILIDESSRVTPEEVRLKLKEYNVESRPLWKPMHLQPIYENNEFITVNEGKDVDRDIFNRGLCLPSDIKMTEEQQDIVIQMIRELF